MTKVEDIPISTIEHAETRSQKWTRPLDIIARRFKMGEKETTETKPKKVVGKSVAVALGIVCILLIASIAYFSVTGISAQNSYNNLQKQNNQLQAWLAGNETSLNQIQADNTNLQNQNTNLTNQISDQNNTISSLNTQISQLNSNLTNLQNQVNTLKVQVGVILYMANINFYGNRTQIDIDVGNSGALDTTITQVYAGTSYTTMYNLTVTPVSLPAGTVQRITLNFSWQLGTTYYFEVVTSTGQTLSWGEQTPSS